MDGDSRGGAVADKVNALDALWLAGIAESILETYLVRDLDESIWDRLDQDAVFYAMAQAQEDASGSGKHISPDGQPKKSWSAFSLAAHAAYQLVFAMREISRGRPPEFYSLIDGVGSSFAEGSLQDCALLLAERVLLSQQIELDRPDSSSEFSERSAIHDFRTRLNPVPNQRKSTAKTTVPHLVKSLKALAGQTTLRHRAVASMRKAVRTRPVLSGGLSFAAGALIATLVAYWLWPNTAPVSSSDEAVTTAPVIPNVLMNVAAGVVNEGDDLTIAPWSSPPSTSLVLVVGDETRSQLHVAIKLRLDDIDGPNPGIDLGGQLPPGTVYAEKRTTLQNAVTRTREPIRDLSSQPTDRIPIHLDEDGTETVVELIVSNSRADNSSSDATYVPPTLRCGYNPAPFTIFLSPMGTEDLSDPHENLVIAVPMYILNKC